MRNQRLLAAGTAMAGAIGLAMPGMVLADASPDPSSVGADIARPESSVIPLALGLTLLAAIAIAVVAKRRPSTRRPIRAAAVLTLGGLFGLVTVLAGLFSDWSGQHRINWPLLIGGGAIVLVSLLWSARIARAGDRTLTEPPR